MGVIGQTGRTVLSDDMVQFKSSHKRTVRYWYKKVKHGFMAQVIGPFHSTLYGTCSFGTKRKSARKALKRRLASDYRYHGNMMLSAVDDADNVGKVDSRAFWQVPGLSIAKTPTELIGSAGQ